MINIIMDVNIRFFFVEVLVCIFFDFIIEIEFLFKIKLSWYIYKWDVYCDI